MTAGGLGLKDMFWIKFSALISVPLGDISCKPSALIIFPSAVSNLIPSGLGLELDETGTGFIVLVGLSKLMEAADFGGLC